jgi:hypothetical protein
VGDVLVATAVERSREGRDGVYDVTVLRERRDEDADEDRDATVVAEMVGRSREIRGTVYRPD